MGINTVLHEIAFAVSLTPWSNQVDLTESSMSAIIKVLINVLIKVS